MKHLRNKTTVITGASRGIGAATARHFAAHGAQVVLAARTGDAIEAIAAEITAAGGNAIAQRCDVSKFGQVKTLIERAIEAYGTLDILVNNAGLIEPVARLADSQPEAWSEVVDVNFKGVYYGLRAALPSMVESGGGVIVNISSGAASGAYEGWSHYCSTKAAVLSLTRCAHLEYAAQGIRVVGISPGTVATDMQVVVRKSGINPLSQLPESAHIPAQWVAKGIAFLCGDGGHAFAGGDFSLKTEEGRALARLPPVGVTR